MKKVKLKRKLSNRYRVFAMTNDWGRPGCEGKYGGIGWYRTINPLTKIGADVESGKFFIGAVEASVKMKERGDIWHIKQMDGFEANVLIINAAKFTGAKLVLDIDDDPFSVDKEHLDYKHHKEKEELHKMLIENVNHIIVSTEPLKKTLQKYNSHITVIENAIDPKIWEVTRPQKRTDGKIRVGWVGSYSHLVDRPVIQDAILTILKKYPQVEFHHAGMAMVDDASHREISWKGTKGYAEYPQFLADMDLDISIAPLKDTKFNRSKSNIKWLENSMLKTPMVLSDVEPYKVVEHGKNGFLAKNTEEWVKYLSMLIEDAELRKTIGENAYQKVQEDWLIEKQLPKYEKLFTKLMPKNISVFTSIVGGYDELNAKQNTDGAEFIAFTDKKSDVWTVLPPYDKFKDSGRNSRIQKIMPHLFMDTEYSIYMDGNFELIVPPQQLIDEFLTKTGKDIAVFTHGGRDCIYDEANAILYYKKETPEAMMEQVKAYAKAGIKPHAGLNSCGIIVRKHTKRINQLNEEWWAQFCRYSKRDQMSFNKVFPKDEVYSIQWSAPVDMVFQYNHPYFKYLGAHKV